MGHLERMRPAHMYSRHISYSVLYLYYLYNNKILYSEEYKLTCACCCVMLLF